MNSKYIRWLLLILLLKGAIAQAGNCISSSRKKSMKLVALGPDCHAKICSYLNARELLFYSRAHRLGRLAARTACQLPSYIDTHDGSGHFLSRYFVSQSWPCNPKDLLQKFASSTSSGDVGSNSKEFYEAFLANTNVDCMTAKHGESLRALSASQRLAAFLIDFIVWDLANDEVGDQFWDRTLTQSFFQVLNGVGVQVEEQVRAQTGAQVRAQVRALFASQRLATFLIDFIDGTQVRALVRNRIWNPVESPALDRWKLMSEWRRGTLRNTLEPAIEKAFLIYHFAWTIERLSLKAAKLRDEVAALLRSKFDGDGEEKCEKIISELMLTSPIKVPHLVLRWIGFLQQPL